MNDLSKPEETGMSSDKADFLKYLQEVRSHYSAYHNHKETSAWAAATLYLAFAIQIATARDMTSGWEGAIRIVAIISLAVAVCRYVEKQFELRQVAASMVEASLALFIEYIPKKEPPPSELFCLSTVVNLEQQTPNIIPKFLESKATELASKGQGARLRFERTIYWVMAMAAIFGSMIIYLRNEQLRAFLSSITS
jgi:hypothetical protein